MGYYMMKKSIDIYCENIKNIIIDNGIDELIDGIKVNVLLEEETIKLVIMLKELLRKEEFNIEDTRTKLRQNFENFENVNIIGYQNYIYKNIENWYGDYIKVAILTKIDIDSAKKVINYLIENFIYRNNQKDYSELLKYNLKYDDIKKLCSTLNRIIRFFYIENFGYEGVKNFLKEEYDLNVELIEILAKQYENRYIEGRMILINSKINNIIFKFIK
jgi:hypothetical protein